MDDVGAVCLLMDTRSDSATKGGIHRPVLGMKVCNDGLLSMTDPTEEEGTRTVGQRGNE